MDSFPLKLVAPHARVKSALTVLVTVFVTVWNDKCKCRQQCCAMNGILFVNNTRYLVDQIHDMSGTAYPLCHSFFLLLPFVLLTNKWFMPQQYQDAAISHLLLKTDAEMLIICNSVKYIVQNYSQNTLTFTCLILQWKCLWLSFFTVNFGKLKWLSTEDSFFLHSQLVKIAIIWSIFPLF